MRALHFLFFLFLFVLLTHALPPAAHPTVPDSIDETRFSSLKTIKRISKRIGDSGLRITGNKAHAELIAYVKKELQKIPHLVVREETFSLLRWSPLDDRSLHDSAQLTLHTTSRTPVDIIGAIPYSLPVLDEKATGELVYLPKGTAITKDNAAGKVVLRELTFSSIPYALFSSLSYYLTPDIPLLESYARPYTTTDINSDLLDAGKAGAKGVIKMFNVKGDKLASYFDPHEGTLYTVPGVFVGLDTGKLLMKMASNGVNATIKVKATVKKVKTSQLFATLKGQSAETIIYHTHTDGASWVQENGIAAVLTLARYFSNLPLWQRTRTLQFNFASSHLHMSTEGSYKIATRLDKEFDDASNTTLVIPVEHLGTREILPSADGTLAFTNKGEVMAWCVGPSPPTVQAVTAAVKRRKLDRVAVIKGIGAPNVAKVPTFANFGGLGTIFHDLLLPTASIISGPWSLWAPSFGSSAIDFPRLRSQILALGDVYHGIQNVARVDVLGDYTKYRQQRAAGTSTYDITPPPERA